jgi:Cytidylyltransferase-like
MTSVSYTVGRFQPPTLGHVRMIDEMLRLARGNPAYVFISSAKDSLIPSSMKKAYLTKMLTRNGVFPRNLTLVDTAECNPPCGGPLGGWAYLKETVGVTGPKVLLVVGEDQGSKFDPTSAPMWKTIEPSERPSIQTIERRGVGPAVFSSTKARAATAASGSSGLKPFLTDGTNEITDKDVELMANTLLQVRSKWKGGAGDEPSAFDEDYGVGGRRKTRRRRVKRSRASSRV